MSTIGFLLIGSLIIAPSFGLASSLSPACATLMAQISVQSSGNEEAYINLFGALVKNKNAIGASAIEIILSQPHPVSPFDFVTLELSKEETFAFQIAFAKLLKSQKSLDWERIKKELNGLVEEKRSSEKNRDGANEDTKALFVPVLRDEIKYQAGEGDIRSTFELSDGAPVAVLWDGDGLYLYEIERRNRIKVGSKFEHNHVHHYMLSSGETLISTHSSVDEIDVYAIDHQHQIRVVKKGYKPIRPRIMGETSSSVYVSESLNHKPAILETLKEHSVKFNREIITGYREVEIDTGNQRLLELLDLEKTDIRPGESVMGHGEKTYIVPNGHVLGHRLTDQDHLIIRDLTLNKVLQDISLTPEFLNKFRFFRFTSTGPGDILFAQHSPGGAARILDINSGDVLNISGKFNESTSIVPKVGGFRIAFENTSVSPIVIYDSKKDEVWNNLPVRFEGAKVSLLKLKNGNSTLFIGSARNEAAKPFLVFPIDGTAPIILDLSREHVKGFRGAYETQDGRVEGLFESEIGFKIVQLYGPLPKKGGK